MWKLPLQVLQPCGSLHRRPQWNLDRRSLLLLQPSNWALRFHPPQSRVLLAKTWSRASQFRRSGLVIRSQRMPLMIFTRKGGKSFIYNSSMNIAVAVAIDGGLITPVLQGADKVDIYSLSRKWKKLVDKARAKQLQPHEYNTGTFTLSNLGIFGVDHNFTSWNCKH
ncbi:unnamed protein product [Musa textilis]